MNQKEFAKLLARRYTITTNILNSKNKEYANENDKLHNFKRAGKMLEQTSEQALVGMWTKHIISILDIVNKLPKETPTTELIDEKIGDAINYLILLEALIKERIGEEQ